MPSLSMLVFGSGAGEAAGEGADEAAGEGAGAADDGGGPGAGPVVLSERLAAYAPILAA